MPSFGLLPEGFVPKPQTVIKEELDTVYKTPLAHSLEVSQMARSRQTP